MFPPIPKYDYSLHTLSFPSFSHTFSTMPNSRKLLPTTNSSLPPTSSMMEDREYSNTSVSCCAYNNLKLNPPFDSVMALTVLVLLTALFFMGFFSIYIRRFADESSVDPTRRRRDPTQRPDPNESTATTSYLAPSRGFKGVEPEMIESLPVHEYYGGDVKQGIYMELELELECAICLSEFEEGDRLKEIPYCGHVFHVECIDMWLSSHVTCPLCRTVKLFPVAKEKEVVEGHVAGDEEEEERGSGVGEMQGNGESDGIEREVRLTVDERDTWSGEEREVEGLDMMRTTNCSRNCERVASHRSLSF